MVCQAFGCTPDKAVELLASPRWRRLTIGCLEARTAAQLVSDFRESNSGAEGAGKLKDKWTARDADFFIELQRAAGYEQPAFDELS